MNNILQIQLFNYKMNIHPPEASEALFFFRPPEQYRGPRTGIAPVGEPPFPTRAMWSLSLSRIKEVAVLWHNSWPPSVGSLLVNPSDWWICFSKMSSGMLCDSLGIFTFYLASNWGVHIRSLRPFCLTYLKGEGSVHRPYTSHSIVFPHLLWVKQFWYLLRLDSAQRQKALLTTDGGVPHLQRRLLPAPIAQQSEVITS